MRAADVSSRSRLVPIAAASVVAVLLGFWVTSGSNSEDVAPAASTAIGEAGESAAPSDLVVVEEPGFFGKLTGADEKLHITVPAGSTISAALEDELSSETAAVGETFSMESTAPILIEGHEAIAAGAVLEGHVAHVAAAGKVSGTGELTLEFDRIITADGSELLIDAPPFHRKAQATKARDAKKVGGLAGIGAAVGGLIGGKKGALIGGAAGASAGAASTLTSKGAEVVLAAGAELTVELSSPLTVIVTRPADDE